MYPTDKIHMWVPTHRGENNWEMIVSPVKILFTDINEYGGATPYGISAPKIMKVGNMPMNLASHDFILEQNSLGAGGDLSNMPGYFTYPYNPWFSFPVTSDCKNIYGGNVPITQFTVGSDNQISYAFVGRYSESRSIDILNHDIKFYYNGNLLAQSWKELREVQSTWWRNPIEPGLFKVEIEDANMMVDGILGRNTFMTEYDNSIEEFTFPALEILQFRNTNNEVTDRFSNSSEGLLTFAAGAFERYFDDYLWMGWYNYEPLQEVKVEYAPNGTDSYKELSVEEDPDKFYMPGYGAYYFATLDQVEGKSENGWFDVRITLVASNGNYQQQTVSPAFKIDNSVGIPTLEEANDNSIIRVAGRNILAPVDAMITTASGLISNGINVTPGIYIIHLSNGKTKKVIVK